jgi:hypothetical protein
MTSQTILLWRDPHEGDLCGASGLLRWRGYHRRPGDDHFLPRSEPTQIGQLARAALGNALQRNTNVLIGWGPEEPATAPAIEIEDAVARCWPCTVFCPERAVDGDRWAMRVFGEVATLGKSAVERTIADFLNRHIPNWQPGAQFRPHALILRVDTTAEALGLIEPHKPTPDDIYASVSTDPAVIAAGRLWDRATPSTHRDLVAAVLAAQERVGIPVADRVPLSSGTVEEYLTPLMMRMGKNDEPIVLAQMRRDLRIRFGEHSQDVLLFMLRTYRHGGTENLLALATGAREAA